MKSHLDLNLASDSIVLIVVGCMNEFMVVKIKKLCNVNLYFMFL
ncbi:hypothetical protein C799_04216 [Bacteroides thetaiotaomicron dnLKV9]|uniref:Uncharacterized protein n=1 Tax=Bacteroides thetaiotaomicron dnLKV9 TaxID=1235785 RepID=R9H260_BACT4|nr:hypothetical protein C799_04216 [Bacteroides thetaiotaomicron dnLKV9]